MYGRHIFMGYLDEDGKTRETFDDDGYLKTGDLGRIDKDGFLFITGRIKGRKLNVHLLGDNHFMHLPFSDTQ